MFNLTIKTPWSPGRWVTPWHYTVESSRCLQGRPSSRRGRTPSHRPDAARCRRNDPGSSHGGCVKISPVWVQVPDFRWLIPSINGWQQWLWTTNTIRGMILKVWCGRPVVGKSQWDIKHGEICPRCYVVMDYCWKYGGWYKTRLLEVLLIGNPSWNTILIGHIKWESLWNIYHGLDKHYCITYKMHGNIGG